MTLLMLSRHPTSAIVASANFRSSSEIFAGRLWGLVLLTTLCGPAMIGVIQDREGRNASA